MTTPITQARFQALVDATTRNWSENAFKELTDEEKMRFSMYNVRGTDRAYEEFAAVTGLPDVPRFNGTLTYASPSMGYSQRIEPAEFALGVEIEYKLQQNNLTNVLKDWAGMLRTSDNRTKERAAAKGYAKLNSAAFDFMPLNEEGVAICSTSHTTKVVGVSTTSGFSNLGTSALDEVSVEATRLLMRGFKNLDGNRISIMPDTLIIPDDLSKVAKEINDTTTGLYGAEGTVNVQKGRWKIITWSMLGDYDTNNWMMADSRYMKKYAVWLDHTDAEMANTIDFETKRIKHSIYSYWGLGFTNWPWIFMHAVS